MSGPRLVPRAIVVGTLASLAVWAFEARTSPETATAAATTTRPDAVVVTNTTTQPVPVAGAVQVSNLPTVQNVAGSVQVTNLPAVQAISGTVEVQAPERRVGYGLARIGEPLMVVPEDVALTDFTITLNTTGTTPSCRVAFHRIVGNGDGIGNLLVIRLSEDHPIAEFHSSVGIALPRFNAYDKNQHTSGFKLLDGDCIANVLWSGYTRVVPPPLPPP